MKIIEALKQIKDLLRKTEDLRTKVGNHCAHMSHETPVYSDQRRQVEEWIQAHNDILKEILRLRVAIQKTNIETKVTIELAGKNITKTIAEWIYRRRELAPLESSVWKKLTDRGLKEVSGMNSMQQAIALTIVRCYDPVMRDTQVAALESEPSTIDARLEIVNAVTDLIEG